MLDEGLHQGCNSPPVEMNQPLNAAPAPSPPAHFLTNIRGEKKKGYLLTFFFCENTLFFVTFKTIYFTS